MKYIISFLFLAFSLSSNAQIVGRQAIDSAPKSANFQCYMLAWVPPTYAATAPVFKRYPLIINLHGAGETGTTKNDLTKLITSNPRSVAGRIADGWNAIAVDPLTGIQDSFIVISPQNNAWSIGYNELRFILPAIKAKYRIDTTRIYIVGLSAGGAGAMSVAGSRDTNFIKQIAAMATANGAGNIETTGPGGTYTAAQGEANFRFASAYGVRVWTIASEQDYLLNTDIRYHDSLNWLLPQPPNKFTVVAGIGHSVWSRAYDPAWRPTISYYGRTGTCNNGCANGGVAVQPNTLGSTVRGSGVTQDSLSLYEWLLTKRRVPQNTPVPTALAGNDQSITLPTNSVTVDGNGSTPGLGSIYTEILWTKVVGPNTYTITSPTSLQTTITGMASGDYIFKLRVTNGIFLRDSDFVRITVYSNVAYNHPTITLTSSATQNISSTSATVSINYTTTGFGLKEIKWQKVKVPNQQPISMAAIGSSTLVGSNASAVDSQMYIRIRNFGTNLGILGTNVNLGLGGTSVYQGMPTGYVPTSGFQDAPDTARNVTKALSFNPDVVLVVYPSNDVEILTVQEVMFAFRTIYNTVVAAGKKCYFTTTQPRQAFGTSAQLKLREIADSMAIEFPNNFIDAHRSITALDGVTALYAHADLIHQVDAGHRVIGFNGIGRNIYRDVAVSSSVITSPNSASTTITGLTNGTHVFMATVTDNHEQTVYVTTTINVTTANQPPVVNAGVDQTIAAPNSQVTVSGTATDPDGTVASVLWTKVSGPVGYLITSPTSLSTTISGLGAGTYVFQLAATDNNGSASTDNITIIVTPQLLCSGIRYIADPTNTGVYYNNINLQPGDTLDLGNKTYLYVWLVDRNGLPGCPIVVMNSGGVANLKASTYLGGDQVQLRIENCRYIKVQGTGSADQYGIKVQPYPPGTRRNGSFAVAIIGKTSNIEVSNLEVRNAGIGFDVKEDGRCDTSYNHPNNRMDSISIHDNLVVGMWNQGMYVGNTEPNNGPNASTPRPIICADTTYYPQPPRMGYLRIFNNIIDSTGRPGIQVVSVSNGDARIYDNIVSHSGMSGDANQGGGITTGAYAKTLIYGNTIKTTLAAGISVIGGSGTDFLQTFENNNIDSSGMLQHYNIGTVVTDIADINTQPVFANTLTWVPSIYVITKPTGGDSSKYLIRNNTLGVRKNNAGILMGDYENTMHKTGTIICNNLNLNGTLAPIATEGIFPIFYSTLCEGSNRRKLRFKKPN